MSGTEAKRLMTPDERDVVMGSLSDPCLGHRADNGEPVYLSDAQTHILALEGEIDVLKEQVRDLLSAESERARLQREVENQEAEIDTLNSTIETLRHTLAMNAEARAEERAALKGELDEARERLGDSTEE